MNTEGLELFDVCAARHKGNAESVAANRRNSMHRTRQQAEVLEAVRAAGENGLTCRELAERWGVGMNTISGRFSELKRAGLIRNAGVRDGCGVYVANNQGE